AVPFPVTIIAQMLGIPARDFATFKRWSDHLVGFLDPLASPGPKVLRKTVDEFDGYMSRLAEERRREPAEDLLTALVPADEQGQRPSAQELQGTLALLLAAGNETTTNLIGNGLIVLLRHPDQLAWLRDDPGIAESAIEELLRWDSPVQLTMRIPTEAVDFDGVHFEKHQAVVTVLGAANHDPEAFARPDVLDPGARAERARGARPGHPLLPRRAARAARGTGGAARARPPLPGPPTRDRPPALASAH